MSDEFRQVMSSGHGGHCPWKNLDLPESKWKVKEVCFIDGMVARPDDPLRKSLCQSGVTGETHQSTPNEDGGERMAT